jgi:hypothetical protein
MSAEDLVERIDELLSLGFLTTGVLLSPHIPGRRKNEKNCSRCCE